MAGGVTYEGAVGGGMFSGKKFFLTQRCPLRSRFIKEIEERGGTVVKLEKFADILIADPERKDAPPNSVSWKYIDLSVRNGVLEDVEEHRIHRPFPAQRAVGSTAPTKQTRTKFTLHDDMILTKYVQEMEAMGESAGANRMWPSFAAKYPNHTWQSWKDRWHKFLKDRPRLDVSQLEDIGAATLSTTGAQPESAAAPARSGRQIPRSAHAPSQSGTSGPVKGKLKFSEEDDALLSAYVRECQQYGHSLSGNKIYKDLAEEYPHHSWHSWRDRWVRHLSVRQTHDAAKDIPTKLLQATKPTPAIPEEGKVLQPSGRTGSTTQLTGAGMEDVVALPPTHTLLEAEPGVGSRDGGNEPDAAEQDVAPVPTRGTTRQGQPETHVVAVPSQSRILSPETNAPNPRVSGATSPKPSQVSTSSSRHAGEQAADASPTTRFKAALREQAPGLTKAERLRWRVLTLRFVDLQARAKGFLTRRALLDQGQDTLDGSSEPVVEASAPLIEQQQNGVHDSRDFPGQTVKCTCGVSEMIGQLRICPTCRTLQHVACCFSAHEENLRDDELYSCVECQHAEVDGETPGLITMPNPNEEVVENDGDPLTHKQAFYTFLNRYVKVTGSDINYFPTIQGRTLDLWDLWHTVISLDEGRHPSARDWEDIAEQLEFDWIATPEVITQLQKCYSKNLGEFEEFLMDFEDETRIRNVASHSSTRSGFPQVMTEEEDDEEVGEFDGKSGVNRQVHKAHTGQKPPMEPDWVVETGEQEPLSDGLPFRSSPPPIRGQKRAYEEDAESVDLGMAFDQAPPRLESISARSFAGRKRARYDEASTIPSTPDRETDVSKFQQASEPGLLDYTRLEPGQNVHSITYARLPEATNDYATITTERRAVVRRPSRRSVQSRRDALPVRAEDVVASIAEPSTTQIQQEPSSPVQVKRRSLPQSFRRMVTPPRTGPGPVPARSRQSMPALHDGRAHPVIIPPQARQSLPSMDKGKGKAVERPYQPRHVSMPKQAKPSSQVPAPPPFTSSATSLPAGKSRRKMDEMVKFIETLYDPETFHDVVRGTGANPTLLNIVCDKIEEARRRGASTNINLLTDSIRGYWREKDDDRLKLIDEFEAGQDTGSKNARERLQKRKEYVKAKQSLEQRFGPNGIQKRREFLKRWKRR